MQLRRAPGIAYQAHRAAGSQGIGGTAIFAAGPERGAAAASAGILWERFEAEAIAAAPTGGIPANAIGAADANALLGGAITFDQ